MDAHSRKGLRRRCPSDPYLPSPPPPPAPPQLERVNSAVPIVAASSLPQSILTHPVYKTLGQQPSATRPLLFFLEWKSRLFWV